MRIRLAESASLTLGQLSELVIPEVATRMVVFQQATRSPDEDIVQDLVELLEEADSDTGKARSYQAAMQDIAMHPGRAKLENRLHRTKGCSLCTAPCLYGFFTLISDPDPNILQTMLDQENKKPGSDRDVVKVLWTYTKSHIWNILEIRDGYIWPVHLGNLSYCLLMLATAKSRFHLREKQLKKYQELNQRTVRRLQSVPLRLV
jgi:hypothetical protein